MKIEIIYQNTKLTTEITKDLNIKDLLQDIKYYFNTNDQNFTIYNSNYQKLKETDIIPLSKTTDKVILYLIKSSKNKQLLPNDSINLKENLNINQLIMKCTGAKVPIEKMVTLRGNRNGLNTFDFNSLDALLNILQGFGENNINPFRNQTGPVEANEQYIEELKSMGFPEDRAREALIISRNNINRATEILLGEGGAFE